MPLHMLRPPPSRALRFPAARRLLAHCLFALLALAAFAPHPAKAAVPHESAVPAYAEEQTILQAEQGAPEPGFSSPKSGRHDFDRHYIIPPGNKSQSDQLESMVILQRGGNTWRVLRNGPLAAISGTLMILMLLAIFGFYNLVGPARLSRPESGRQMRRFSGWDRLVHWATAISFLLMAITGLIILFGKKLILPWLGHSAFSWLAVISKYLHNFVGPLFILCSVLLFVTFVRKNFFHRWDWVWIRKFGGLVSHQPVPAGYFNAGEKAWFWGGVTLLGLVMSITGLLLDFLAFGQTRYIQQWANYLHLAGATFYIVAAMGHIYIGTWGTPGAYHAMRHGTVDEEWAREHHRLWYDEVHGNVPPEPPGSSHPPGPGAAPVRGI